MKKAVFLDRDGTINVDKRYLYKIKDFEYLDGVIEGLKRFQEAGYLLFIVTNQSGIARGYYTEEDYLRLNSWMLDDLKEKGILITETYYCPHHIDAVILEYKIECDCRKPRLNLFYKAIEKYDIDINNSVVIGDKERDLALCQYGADGYLVYSEKETSSNYRCMSEGINQVSKIVCKRE